MVQPRKYTRSHDFTQEDGDTTDHSSLNAELDAAGISINGLRTNLALIQKDDGTLQAKVVKAEHLSDDAFNAVMAALAEAKFAAQKAANDAELAASQALRIRNMYDRYQGDSAIEPASRLDGTQLQPGDLYFDTTLDELCVYASTGWKTANDTYERSELYSRSEIDAKFVGGNGANGTWPISVTGDSVASAKLKTARKIGGVPFDGGADIDLPGVNMPSNQPISQTQVMEAIAQLTTAGGVGSFAFMAATGIGFIGPNDLVNGSVLYPSSANGTLQATYQGTWRCLGFCRQGAMLPVGARSTLFIRVA